MTSASFPTLFGEFRLHACRGENGENIALIYGDINASEPALVRIHSRCLTGDVFHSMRCDCGEQLERSLKMIIKEGAGVLVYLDQEGRGIGLLNKIKAYELQDKGLDTVEANHQLGFKGDERSYAIAAAILKKLEISKVRLITNNPDKVEGLRLGGLEIVERVPLIVESNRHNEKYLKTKKEKMGHLI